MKKILQIVTIVLFCAGIFLPILFMNKGRNIYSKEEKRQLANFPDILVDDGKISPTLTKDTESWLNDNIGFRTALVTLHAKIKLDIFNISPTEKVEKGRDGWLFYTLNNNIEIAEGKYPLTEETLKGIAYKQQVISDWYKSQGKDYILVLTPSKSSIYPEYIASGRYSVRETAIDILEKYMNEHTDVKVINCKNAVLEAKGDKKLFFKTDTHWTPYGAYFAYREIVNKLNSWGIINDDPVETELCEETELGDLVSMLGSTKVLPPETVPSIRWKGDAKKSESGDFYERIRYIDKSYQTPDIYLTDIFENTSKDKTLFIYGDSQWMTMRKLPNLLAEHFGKTACHRGKRVITLNYDNAVNPDIVLYACSERNIGGVLTLNLTIPDIINNPDELLSEYPRENQSKGDIRLVLDKVNGIIPDNKKDIVIKNTEKNIELFGWAADVGNKSELEEVYLKIGNTILKAQYGIQRKDIDRYFETENMINSGFKITVPMEVFNKAGKDKMEFILVTKNGYKYNEINYSIR